MSETELIPTKGHSNDRASIALRETPVTLLPTLTSRIPGFLSMRFIPSISPRTHTLPSRVRRASCQHKKSIPYSIPHAQNSFLATATAAIVPHPPSQIPQCSRSHPVTQSKQTRRVAPTQFCFSDFDMHK